MLKRPPVLASILCAAALTLTAPSTAVAAALPFLDWFPFNFSSFTSSPSSSPSFPSFFWPFGEGEEPPDDLAPADPGHQVVINPERKAKGVILAIHGGGWVGSTDYVDATPKLVERYADWGWRVQVVGYRSGARGLADLERWYRRVRERIDPGKPVCAWGGSAGAHLALMLAGRTGLDCVIAEAGPTYLPDAQESLDLPDWVDELAAKAFGGAQLRAYSPLVQNRGLRTPTLLGHARDDEAVPIAQARRYARKIAKAKLIDLAPGGAEFTHSAGVASADVSAYRGEQKKLLRKAAKRTRKAARRR